MTRTLTAKSSLQSLRKEAKRWLKALRANDAEAWARLRRVNPRPPDEPVLRAVQHALALEHGAQSWAALKLQLADNELAGRSDAKRAAEFLEQACLNYGIRPASRSWDRNYPDDPSRRDYAARMLARHPEIARHSIHTAAVCGDLTEIQRILARKPQAASAKSGPQQWEPLLHLCYARLPIAAARDNAVAVATALLDHGADPNASMTDGENPFTAITGAIGEGERTPAQVPPHPQAEALVSVLIERGADPFDTQALYNTSLWHDDDRWLEFLYGHSARSGQAARWTDPQTHLGPRYSNSGTLSYLLGNAVGRNHVRRAEWLLAHGAKSTALNAYSKRNLHTEAELMGFTEMAALLRRTGADVETLEGHQAFQAACMRLDRATARSLAQRHPQLLSYPGALLAAATTGRTEAVALLLELGTPASLEGADHTQALHQCVWADSVDVAKLLIAHGADVDSRERKFGATPLGWAIHLDKPRLVEYLSGISRDVFSLAAVGNVERLRALLSAEPALARAQMRDRTALFFLPVHDEDRAMEVVELLLAHGADPTVTNAQGATAAQVAAKQGMEAVAELLRDGAG